MINPTTSLILFGGLVTVHAFGVTKIDSARHNWSLKYWKESEMFFPTMRALATYAPINAHIFAPYPTDFNAKVVNYSKFNEKREHDGITLWRGPKADGVVLHAARTAFAVSSADCATLVVSYEDLQRKPFVIVAHAGRNSLIDMEHFKEGKASRAKESVVHSILEMIPRKCRQNAQAWVGIAMEPGEHFAHSKNNPLHSHNAHLIDYILKNYGEDCLRDDGSRLPEGRNAFNKGWLDIKKLIKEQLVRGGLRRENIVLDNICTYQDKKTGEHVWYSQVREKNMRNLVLVSRVA